MGWLHSEGDTEDVAVEGYEEYPASEWIDSNTLITVKYYSFDVIDNNGNIVAPNEKETSNETQEDATTNASSNGTQNASNKTIETEEEKFDIDEDVILVLCERNAKYTTQYDISFSNLSGTKYYNFGYSVNPRQMGDEFNAIGDLPMWFTVGFTVHLQANLNSSGELRDVTVTEVKGTENNETTNNTNNKDVPVISGLYLNDVVDEIKKLGVSEYNYGDDYGDGTSWVSYISKSEGIQVDIAYTNETKEIVYVTVFTDLRATDDEQVAFVNGVSGFICPKDDSASVGKWVGDNLYSTKATVINGIDYSLHTGVKSGCLMYEINVSNWENWVTIN